jgi:hypothetical protein
LKGYLERAVCLLRLFLPEKTVQRNIFHYSSPFPLKKLNFGRIMLIPRWLNICCIEHKISGDSK